VRRAFLCGSDPLTGFNFEHRRQWIVDRIKLLCSVFAVDLCAYAVMSNHYHIVVRINTARADEWTDEEVAHRWMRIFSGPLLMHKYLANADLASCELKCIAELVATWRKRLANLSWFMRCINEPIARMANSEDHCTGSFWEGRFKSQALLDERALLACMAYVDLNPIRAAMATTPEQSDYTSVQERLKQPDSGCLAQFSEQGNVDTLPFNLREYLKLLDWDPCFSATDTGQIANECFAGIEVSCQRRPAFTHCNWARKYAAGLCCIRRPKICQRPCSG